MNGSVTIDSEATLQVGDGYSNGVVGSITDNGTLLFRPNSSGESYSGVISGIGSLMVVGSGSSGGYPTLTLAGANTFTGLTQISGGGTLALGSSLALQDSTLDTTNFPSSSLSIGTLTAVTLGGLQGPSGTTLNLSGGAVTLTVGNNGTNTTFSGSLSGGCSLIKSGSGTLTLAGTDTYTGTTTINAGTLQAGSSGSGTTARPSGTTVSLANTAGATLQIGAAQTIAGLTGGGGTGGNVVTGAYTLSVNAGSSCTYNGVISGIGGLTKGGRGTLTLGGANTFTGVTQVTGGTLTLGVGSALQDSTLDTTNFGSNSLNFGSLTSATFGGLQGTGNLTLPSSFVLTVGNNGTNTTFSGSLSGGSLSKVGSGTLTLAGANTYTGGTTISAGTLAVGSTSQGMQALPNGRAVTLANTSGAQLVLNANQTIGSLSGGGTTGGNIVLGSYTLTVSPSSTTFGGVISGGGGLTISGGALTLAGANTYSGSTTVVAGSTLQVGSGGITGTLGSGGVTVNGSLVFDRSDNVTVANNISGTGSLAQQGSGTLTLTGNNNAYTGITQVTAGTLSLNNSLALQDSTLDTTNFTSTSLSFGNLASATFGGLQGAGNLTLPNSLALTVGNSSNNASTTFSGSLSGGGSLIKSGGGTLTFVGANTYAGGTTIDQGVLQVGNGTSNGSLPAGGTIIDGGTLSFLPSSSGEVYSGGNISGSGTLSVGSGGSGVLTLRVRILMRLPQRSIAECWWSAVEVP